MVRFAAPVLIVSLALAAAGAIPAAAADPQGREAATGLGIASRGRIYHVEYLRARPGMEDDYDRFVETVFRPMLEEMVRRGVWIQYNFLTVPYAGPAPCADYTHVFVATLANFAAVDREIAAWGEVIRKFHPDEAERHRLFDEELPRLREMVREEFLRDFSWK
jgi:hypothetical protein